MVQVDKSFIDIRQHTSIRWWWNSVYPWSFIEIGPSLSLRRRGQSCHQSKMVVSRLGCFKIFESIWKFATDFISTNILIPLMIRVRNLEREMIYPALLYLGQYCTTWLFIIISLSRERMVVSGVEECNYHCCSVRPIQVFMLRYVQEHIQMVLSGGWQQQRSYPCCIEFVTIILDYVVRLISRETSNTNTATPAAKVSIRLATYY